MSDARSEFWALSRVSAAKRDIRGTIRGRTLTVMSRLLSSAQMVSDTFVPVRTAVLTISDTRTEQTDTSGRLAVERLEGAGHHIAWKEIVPDDLERVRSSML